MTVIELASIAVTPEAEREPLQRIPVEIDDRIPVEVDEIITSFAKTYAQMAELQRVLQRTYHRAEHALALARAIRRSRLGLAPAAFRPAEKPVRRRSSGALRRVTAHAESRGLPGPAAWSITRPCAPVIASTQSWPWLLAGVLPGGLSWPMSSFGLSR